MAQHVDYSNTGIPTRKIVLWAGIVSIIMIFAGLTSAYIVRQAEGNWTHFELPFPFYISTAIILLSSLTLNMATIKVKNNNLSAAPIFLGLTLILGIAFVISQYLGWTRLVASGIFLVGNPSGSFLYILTGLHVLHLIAGLISLLYTYIQSTKKKYQPKSYLGLQLCAIYWHFLGALWVYLFFFLLLIR